MAKTLVTVAAMLDNDQQRALKTYLATSDTTRPKSLTRLVVCGLEAVAPKATTATAKPVAPKPPIAFKPKPKPKAKPVAPKEAAISAPAPAAPAPPPVDA